MVLADINIWLALVFSGHPHHRPALAWFDAAPVDSVAFCRMTQQGFLRLSTNPRVFKTDALDMAAAWDAYDLLSEDERVFFLLESENVEAEWRKLTLSREFSPKVWNDAYLAAAAIDSGATLVSFDRGFTKFDGLKSRILE